jgi:hypothetical protein
MFGTIDSQAHAVRWRRGPGHHGIGWSRALVAAALLVIGSSTSIRGEPGASYFDSPFDGNWLGSFQPRAGADRFVPALLNLNIQGEDGLGSGWLPADLTTVSEGFHILDVRNLRRRNRKIVFDLVLAELPLDAPGRISSYSVTLSFKPASDTLRGRLAASDGASADGAVARGPVLLYRAGPTVPIQRMWVGSLDIDGTLTPLMLQIIAEGSKTRLGRKRREADSRPDPVTGFGYLGAEFGNLERGRLSGDQLIGRLALDGGPLSFKLGLSVSGHRLIGTLERHGSSQPITLVPVATPGRRVRIDGVTPAEAPLGAPVTLRITGRHLSPGTLVHAGGAGGAPEPTAVIRTLELVSAEEIRVTLVGDYGEGEPRSVSLRIVAPDGQRRDRERALRLVNPEVISFENHIKPVFSSSCDRAGCHSSVAPAAHLNLSAGSAYANIVRVRSTQMPQLNRIEPRDPANSYLIRKLKGEVITGARMPQGAPPLSDGVLALFDRWVLEGAKRR